MAIKLHLDESGTLDGRNERSGSLMGRASGSVSDIRADYLLALTDDTGVFQHAKGKIPWREHGYCSDDVARALVFAVRHRGLPRLARTCMSFLLDAAVPGVGFRNFLSYDRRWLEQVGSPDCQGRVVWSLGVAFRDDPYGFLAMPATHLLREIVPDIHLGTEHPRTWAYALLGLACTDDPRLAAVRGILTEKLLDLCCQNSRPGWAWFEDHLSYANALLCQAAILQHEHPGAVATGLSTLEWLFDHQRDGDFMSFSGNCRKTTKNDKPLFDQQPIEAQEMSAACTAAFMATGEAIWIERQHACHAWFMGENFVGVPLADPLIGACADGLGANGPSLNHGAESTLAYLLTQADGAELPLHPNAGVV
jgi:hypothetical protein